MSRIMPMALCAALFGAGILAPQPARAQAPHGETWRGADDAFERGYRMGREDERRSRERDARRQDRGDWTSGGDRLRDMPRLDGRPYGAYGYERFEEGWLGEGRLTR